MSEKYFPMMLPMIDIHIHLLPGVDDGPPIMRDALALAHACAQAGTEVAICTPHLIPRERDNTRSLVLPAIQTFKEQLKRAAINLKLLPGAEAMAHPSLLDLHEEGELPTLGDHGIHLLLELPWQAWPPALEDLIFDLQQRGLSIIIAHPERYGPVGQDPGIVGRWVSRGLMMQVTARSLARSGSTTGTLARRLLEEGLVHFIASDSHSTSRATSLVDALDWIAERYGEGARQQAIENAAAVATGATRALPPIPAFKPRRRWLPWLR